MKSFRTDIKTLHTSQRDVRANVDNLMYDGRLMWEIDWLKVFCSALLNCS